MALLRISLGVTLSFNGTKCCCCTASEYAIPLEDYLVLRYAYDRRIAFGHIRPIYDQRVLYWIAHNTTTCIWSDTAAECVREGKSPLPCVVLNSGKGDFGLFRWHLVESVVLVGWEGQWLAHSSWTKTLAPSIPSQR